MRIAFVFTKTTTLGQLQNFLALAPFKHGQVCYFWNLGSRKFALTPSLKQSVAQWAACAFFFFLHAILLARIFEAHLLLHPSDSLWRLLPSHAGHFGQVVLSPFVKVLTFWQGVNLLARFQLHSHLEVKWLQVWTQSQAPHEHKVRPTPREKT